MARKNTTSMDFDVGESRKKRVVLDRAISMTTEKISTGIPLSKFQTSSLRSRWKNHWQDTSPLQQSVTTSDDESEESLQISGNSPPCEDIPTYESFDSSRDEELRVRLCKESIRQNLIDQMKSLYSNSHTLEDIEEGKINSENLIETFQNKSKFEINIAFLWCAFLKRSNLLSGLLQCGADLHKCDESGLSALHLAAFSGCLKCCQLLINRGANVNLIVKQYTPLHSAAFGNSVEAAKVLLDRGARFDYYENGFVGDGTAMHSAVKANAVECLELFISRGADVNSIQPGGCSPLHAAADLNRVNCLRTLLELGRGDANLKTREKKSTPLHFASFGGYRECVSLLLEHGADADCQNKYGQTPLHLAAKSASLECAELLLLSGKCNPNAFDNEMRTPLHSAVSKSLTAYEIVELLVQKKANVNERDKYGYTPLHIAALNELSLCVETLLYHGADVGARTAGGTSALNIIVRKTPDALNMMYQKLDNAISMHDVEFTRKEVELKLDFRVLLQNKHEHGEVCFLKSFVDEGQKDILLHPLCEAFLYLKWQKIRKYFFARLFVTTLFVLNFTLYVWMVFAEHCTEKSAEVFPQFRNICESSILSELAGGPESLSNFIRTEHIIVLILCLFELFRKIVGIGGFSSFKQYFFQIDNIIDWFVILSVFGLTCIFPEELFLWQSHIAAFAVLFAWMNLMLLMGQLPIIGPYISMYTKVMEEFIKLLLSYSCLLIGFAVSFCILFPVSNIFKNPLLGLVQVIVMMTGELNYNDLPLSMSNEEVFLESSAFVIFVLFLFFVTVALMNLLVGIAVHDIQGLQKTAGLSKLVRQTRLISYIERALLNDCLPRYIRKFLQWTAFISPAAYRVVMYVKPLNPNEKRLPKHILKGAHEIAKSRKSNKCTLSSQMSFGTTPASTILRGRQYGDIKGRKAFVDTPDFLDKIQDILSNVESNSQSLTQLIEKVDTLQKIVVLQQETITNLTDICNKSASEC